MITTILKKAGMNPGKPASVWLAECFGLEADEKPTDGIPNGSHFIELDTGKEYYFDEDNTLWIEKV